MQGDYTYYCNPETLTRKEGASWETGWTNRISSGQQLSANPATPETAAFSSLIGVLLPSKGPASYHPPGQPLDTCGGLGLGDKRPPHLSPRWKSLRSIRTKSQFCAAVASMRAHLRTGFPPSPVSFLMFAKQILWKCSWEQTSKRKLLLRMRWSARHLFAFLYTSL